MKKTNSAWLAIKRAFIVIAFILILFFTSILFALTLLDFKGIVFKETTNKLTYFILMLMYLLAGLTILLNIYDALFPQGRKTKLPK